MHAGTHHATRRAMPAGPRTTGFGALRALAARFAATGLLAAMVLLPPTARAQRVEGDRAQASGLYASEVTVRSQADGERLAGLRRALAQVLVKLSGDDAITTRDGVANLLAHADDYLAGFDYRNDTPSAVGSGMTTTLVARFDADKLAPMLDALGIPVWPEPRPRPVLWLAIDDGSGQGPRLVALKQANVARAVLDRAKARGFALGLPQGDAAELALAAALWRGDTGAIARASARYAPPMQLLGKLYRSGNGWKADWIMLDGGKVIGRDSDTNANALTALASGADMAADALGRRYARGGNAAAPIERDVRIAGLDANSWLRVAAWLEAQPLLAEWVPRRAKGNALELHLRVLGGADGLARLLADKNAPVIAVPGQAAPGEADLWQVRH